MQIILSKEECETIYESLLTELGGLEKGIELEIRLGRSTALSEKYIQGTKDLMKRFQQYVGNE